MNRRQIEDTMWASEAIAEIVAGNAVRGQLIIDRWAERVAEDEEIG